MKPTKNYLWYVKADVSKYKGKWIAIVNQKVVAVGARAKDVVEEAEKKYPTEQLCLAKVPTEETLILFYGNRIRVQRREI